MKGLVVFGALIAAVAAASWLLLPKQYRPQFYIERDEAKPPVNSN
jgi:hypothetical protein